MTYVVTKYIKGNPYLYEVRSEREGDRVVQRFVRYIGRAGSAKAEARAAEIGMEEAPERIAPAPRRQAVAPTVAVEAETPAPKPIPIEEITPPVTPTPVTKEPWEMTREEFIANPPEGYNYDPDLESKLMGHRALRDAKGKPVTTLGDTFFKEPDLQARRILLKHEEGHDLMRDFNRDWKDVLELFRLDKDKPISIHSRYDNPFGASDKPEEIVADAYASLWEKGFQYEDPNYPANLLRKQVVKVALSEGKPIPLEVLRDYPDLAKVTPTTEVTKEPWQITTAEYVTAEETPVTISKTAAGWFVDYKGSHDLPRRTIQDKTEAGKYANTIRNYNSLKQQDEHFAIVQRAISEGKPIPPEVLRDYPELAPMPTPEVIKPVAVTPVTPEVTRIKPSLLTEAEADYLNASTHGFYKTYRAGEPITFTVEGYLDDMPGRVLSPERKAQIAIDKKVSKLEDKLATLNEKIEVAEETDKDTTALEKQKKILEDELAQLETIEPALPKAEEVTPTAPAEEIATPKEVSKPQITKKEGSLIAKYTETKMSPETGLDTEYSTEYRLIGAPENAGAEWMGNEYGIIRIFSKGGVEVDRDLLEVGMSEDAVVKALPWETSYKKAEKFGLAKTEYEKYEKELADKEQAKEAKERAEEAGYKRYQEAIANLGSIKGIKKTDITYFSPVDNEQKTREGFDVGNGVGIVVHEMGRGKEYAVTHINTGLAMGHNWKNRAEAIALAKSVAKITDWSKYSNEKEIPQEIMSEAASLVRGFTQKNLPLTPIEVSQPEIPKAEEPEKQEAEATPSIQEIQYSRDLDIRNIEALPKGTGAKYLITLKGQGDELIAKQWARVKPTGLKPDEVLVSMIPPVAEGNRILSEAITLKPETPTAKTIKVASIPPDFVKLDQLTAGSESWARTQRKIYLRYNAGQYGTTKINPEDVVVYHNSDTNQWEVWQRRQPENKANS